VTCPNKKCGRQTTRLLVKVTPKGKVIEGCPACVPLIWEKNVRTGRKIWTGQQVDGEKKNREKIYEWGEKLQRRAAQNRRTWSPLREARD
jgi:hypothetical protein